MYQQADSLREMVDQIRMRYPGLEPLRLIISQTDAEFDDALEGLFEQAVDYLEKNANHLNKLDEEAISSFLIAFLNMPGVKVSQETHSRGHVDITIEAVITSPLRRRLGEAKIYNGPAYHVKGLEQLINRYTTGREGSGIVVEYIKDQGIAGLVKKIREHLDQIMPCTQNGISQDHWIKWAFITHHIHSSGEKFRVLHINCNLYTS
jgi:hypothetical protein